MEKFTILTEKFQGPLELLLELVEKRKLLINDISLAKVADDFITYTEQAEHIPISESANFILVASTLVLIKSKSLLPTLELTTEEQHDIHDLENRLKELQRIKELSKHIEERFGTHIAFQRQPAKNSIPVFSPTDEIHITSIGEALRRVIAVLPKPAKLSQTVVKKIVSLEETISKLIDRVQANMRMSFKEFSTSGKTENIREAKVHVVVSFLAVLELVKRGMIQVTQHNTFGDIHMESGEVQTPRYGV